MLTETVTANYIISSPYVAKKRSGVGLVDDNKFCQYLNSNINRDFEANAFIDAITTDMFCQASLSYPTMMHSDNPVRYRISYELMVLLRLSFPFRPFFFIGYT